MFFLLLFVTINFIIAIIFLYYYYHFTFITLQLSFYIYYVYYLSQLSLLFIIIHYNLLSILENENWPKWIEKSVETFIVHFNYVQLLLGMTKLFVWLVLFNNAKNDLCFFKIELFVLVRSFCFYFYCYSSILENEVDFNESKAAKKFVVNFD